MSVFDQHRWNRVLLDDPRSDATVLDKVDPSPVELLNKNGTGAFVLGCEHAGNRTPSTLGTLGLSEAELSRHIAWDIGAADLTRKLAERLDIPAVLQRYSRLVYDCNRSVRHTGAFVIDADGAQVSVNSKLTDEAKLDREAAIYRPFHNELSSLCDARRWRGERFAYVAVHSFNSTLGGHARPWHVGFLYNQQPAMSRYLIDWFRANTDYEVGDNQPYSPLDAVDHTLRVQAEVRSIPYTMIEIRNDLLRSDAQIDQWVALLSQALRDWAKANNL